MYHIIINYIILYYIYYIILYYIILYYIILYYIYYIIFIILYLLYYIYYIYYFIISIILLYEAKFLTVSSSAAFSETPFIQRDKEIFLLNFITQKVIMKEFSTYAMMTSLMSRLPLGSALGPLQKPTANIINI